MSTVSSVLVKSFITNIFLSILKIMMGVLGHSHAMVADGFNSLSDLSTDIIAIMGNILSKKNSDKSHPYGYGKIEYLTNIIIGIMIIIMGVLLIINAFNFKYSPSEDIIMYICIITIVIKVWIANYLIDNGKILNNSIVISSGYESLVNVLSSFLVLMTIVLSKLTGYGEVFKYSDFIGTILVSLIIIYAGFNIFRENTSCILGKSEDDKEYIEKLRKIVLTDKRVKKIDKLNVIKYGSYYQVELTVLVSNKLKITDSYKIQKDLRRRLIGKRHRIHYLEIVVNPE